MAALQYPALSPLTGLGFRVIARNDQAWFAHPGFNPRNPSRQHDWNSIDDHLRNRRVAGPWKSVFVSWQAALTRRRTFIDQGATEVWILVVDLEGFGFRDREYFLKDVIDAHSFAVVNNLPSLQFYGYVGGRLHGFSKEYLMPHGILREAVVAYIPASDGFRDVAVHLGVMRIPEALALEVQHATGDAIRKWVQIEIQSCTGVADDDLSRRLMRAMCIRAWDYD